MEFDQIADIHSLGKWLQGKPYTWEQAIAFRSTMRALPVLKIANDDWLDKFAIAVLRPIIVLDSLKNHNAMLHPTVISKAVTAAIHASNSASPPVAALGCAAANALESEYDIEENPYDFANFDLHSKAIYAIDFAITAITTAEQDPVDAKLREEQMWVSVRSDCFWLERNATLSKFKRISNRNRIWSSSPPMGWSEDWANLKGALQRIHPDYSVWIDWYERRIRGERAAFDILGDKGRIEDKKILRRLAEATDEDFWGKGHEYVNTTLKDWLDEARDRVAPPLVSAEAHGVLELSGSGHIEVGPVPPPAQNRNALSFRADEYGRITIDTTALADQLRIDAGAQDRHSEAVAEAKMVFDRCQRSNAGARLTRLFDNYLDAAGESVEVVKPSLLVQRGERLRQELEAYTNPDSFLDPLADDLLLDMKGWQSAHNMMVGLDPVLNAMDTAILGPDRQPSLMPPDEIRQKSEAADEAGILADNVAEVLIEAADLAPVVPDPTDRRTILSNEMMRNLIIEAFSVAMNNPKKAVVGIVVTGVAVSAMPAGTTLLGVGGGAMAAAGFLVREREWIEKQMGNTPAWRDLFLHVSKLIEEKTHFKPKSSDKSE